MTPDTPHIRVTATIPPALHQALLTRAEQEGRSLSGLVAFLLREALKHAPDPASPGETFHMVDHGPAPGARPDRPEDYLDPEHVRRQREMHDRLRATDLKPG